MGTGNLSLGSFFLFIFLVGVSGTLLKIRRQGKDYIYTSGTPAFGQDIDGFYTIINIATTNVILSYYTPLNFEFRLPGGLTFNIKVALAGNAKSPPTT